MELQLTAYANAAISIGLLTAAYILFSGPIRSLFLDIHRQRIFELRDRLFDMAVAGEISFNDPVYAEVRDGLHRTIRILHMMTIPDIVFAAVMISRRRELPENRLRDAIASVQDPDLRRRLECLEAESISHAIRCGVFRSPLTMSVCIAIMLGLVALHQISDWKQIFRDRARTMRSDADMWVPAE
jgi:hypothetical protein